MCIASHPSLNDGARPPYATHNLAIERLPKIARDGSVVQDVVQSEAKSAPAGQRLNPALNGAVSRYLVGEGYSIRDMSAPGGAITVASVSGVSKRIVSIRPLSTEVSA